MKTRFLTLLLSFGILSYMTQSNKEENMRTEIISDFYQNFSQYNVKVKAVTNFNQKTENNSWNRNKIYDTYKNRLSKLKQIIK